MIDKTEQNLSPVGFYDLLFEEAEENHRKINLALDFFMSCQYRLIKTPLAEFCDNFSSQQLTSSFLIQDVISGKNLALRNDITLQISRLLRGRLKNEKPPLKLCYVGDVLFTKNNELYADRQSTQLGVEIIGCDQYKSNIEIIEIILETLSQIASKKLLIEVSLPNFLQILCEELDIDLSADLIDAVRQKNISKINKLAAKNSELINEIALKNNDLKKISQKILSKTNSAKIIQKLSKAAEIANFVNERFPEVAICFDLFGDNLNNSYHQEISFDVFCGNLPYAIARGGRYKINNIDAVGATVYMNYLRKL